MNVLIPWLSTYAIEPLRLYLQDKTRQDTIIIAMIYMNVICISTSSFFHLLRLASSIFYRYIEWFYSVPVFLRLLLQIFPLSILLLWPFLHLLYITQKLLKLLKLCTKQLWMSHTVVCSDIRSS